MKPVWLIQLQQDNSWFTAWVVDYNCPNPDKEMRLAVAYAVGKILDGSDADAFRVIRKDKAS